METQEAPYPILYRDDHFIAVEKPTWTYVHRPKVRGERILRIQNAMRCVRDYVGGWVYPVHRLDRRTSGVLLFALSPEAASRAGKLMMARGFSKRYEGICRGWIPSDTLMTINYALKRETTQTDAEAITEVRALHRIELPFPVGRYTTARYTLFEAIPLTGRFHQIRRHLKHISHPIIGDNTRGDLYHNRFIKNTFGESFNRLLLHACELKFTHPFSQEEVVIQSPSPLEWRTMVTNFSSLLRQDPACVLSHHTEDV